MSNIQGLTDNEAKSLLLRYGPNAIPEKKKSALTRIAKKVISPMSAMFVAAGLLSLFAGESADAGIIAVLFATNIGVSVWHESKADNALEMLKKRLAVSARVLRDGVWRDISSADIVPGDIVSLVVGDLVPADIEIVEAKNVSINEAAITGESLPKDKAVGDKSYSGAFMTTGSAKGKVIATGAKTYFGTTMTLVEGNRRRSALEKDIISVSKFLSIISVTLMIVLSIVLAAAHEPFIKIATLAVSMLIAGIPVALPTVMTLIISVGVTKLAGHAVIVRRLSSLEDLANVNLLLSDKTGTLTENRITVHEMIPMNQNYSAQDIWSFAMAASPDAEKNPLDIAVTNRGHELNYSAHHTDDFIPGDSIRKRATAIWQEGDRKTFVAFGAPQTILDISDLDEEKKARYNAEIAKAAKEGFRILSLAISTEGKEEHMDIVAVFLMADKVRSTAKTTIAFLKDYGIATKMVTGDGYDVAKHVAGELGIEGDIIRRNELEGQGAGIVSRFAGLGGFAEVLPKDKYDIVNMAKTIEMSGANGNNKYIVAVTGDGVNDVPPVKSADVGIAVANAVDALKSAADIVLTSSGISVIRDAIVEARKIFARLYNYSVYRISESFRLIVTIAVIGAFFATYPLTPIQIILIALLNDVPIISLSYDRVVVSRAPTGINAKKRFLMSSVYGTVGIANSLILLFIAYYLLHLPWDVIQTIFFLKLTVSGHMLVYVAHTDRPWYSFLPSKQVVWATSVTQIIATMLAVIGIFVTAIPITYAIFIWLWAFMWMQITELAKSWLRRDASVKVSYN